MLPVQVGHELYKVTWQHNQSERTTTCFIFTEDENGDFLVASEVALCHPNDPFTYNIGRRISLAKAIRTAIPRVGVSGLDRRQAFWTAYREMRNGKW